MAYELLAHDAASATAAVRTGVKVELKQHEFDALVSFVFNVVGAGAFPASNVAAVA